MNSSRGTDRLPQGVGEIGKAGAAVSVAAAAANLLAYLVPLLGARRLGADDLGAIATVVAILAIVGVPGLGLQLAVAVARAKHGSVDRLNRLIALAIAAAAVPLLVLTPVLASVFRLPWQAIPLTAVITAAVIAASGWLGLLQGSMRFSRLAVGMGLLGVARCGGMIAGLALGMDLIGLLGLGAVVAIASAAAIRGLVPPSPQAGAVKGLARGVWAAGSATLIFFVLSYADLLAARYLLPAAASADYTVLNVLTKGAMWAPQVISIVALPYLARDARKTRWVAASGVVMVGLLMVAASALFGAFAVWLAGGEAYVHLAGYAPAFAAVGALYALVFVLTNAQVAAGARAPAAPLWVAVAVFAGATLLVRPSTVGAIVTCALVTATASAIALVVVMCLTMRSTQATERA